jgi:pimeloyl-ACP methyl ester carboxylesterase
MMKLGKALSDKFTVFIPDRRGRGLSGPFGDNYNIQKEDEDMDALITETGAYYVFGTADGALFALHAAIILHSIKMIVAYEPVLFVGQSGVEEFKASMVRFDNDIAEGKLADAMVGLTKSANIKFINYLVPDILLEQIFRLYIWNDARNIKGDDVSGKDLLPTAQYEFQIVQETEGTIEDYKNVSAEVLLFNSSKSAPLIEESIIALNKVLPHSKRIELKGLNHDSAQNYGKPEIIAQEIKLFLE